jgi:hypothetical protein
MRFMLHPLYRLASICVIAIVVGLTTGSIASASDDVSALIDQQLEAHWKEKGITQAPVAEDRAFVRRIYLDLAGRIPTLAELQAFLQAARPDKRTALVDQLLTSADYARHMREQFDVMLMGRGDGDESERRERRRGGRGQQRGPQQQKWREYLEKSFAENRPWDAMVRDMLVARPESDAQRGAVWFLYQRGDNYQGMAEAASAGLLGVQVQCAQCHDHPLADEIEQRHYWGLVAVFSRSKSVDAASGPGIAESAGGAFLSFSNLAGKSFDAPPAFMKLEATPEEKLTDEQAAAADYYLVPPVGKDQKPERPAVPKYSRRESFFNRVLAETDFVPRGMVNRMWGLLMGRGIVHPIDKIDSDHVPSHPALLEALTFDFRDHGYDVRRLVRGIVLSRAYQLDSHPVDAVPVEAFAYGLEKPLSAEAYWRSICIALGNESAAGDKSLEQTFCRLFPDVAAEQTIANLQQAMFLTNNSPLNTLVGSEQSTTFNQLLALASPEEQSRQLFLTTLGREPDAEEAAEAVRYLGRGERRGTLQQLAWALITSAEFRLNH